MDPQIQKIIVLIVVMSASFITWKIIKDFYAQRIHALFSHIIAVITASFMFLSSMFLFVPENYKRGMTAEIELKASSIIIIIAMLAIIYFIFRYLPNKK